MTTIPGIALPGVCAQTSTYQLASVVIGLSGVVLSSDA